MKNTIDVLIYNNLDKEYVLASYNNELDKYIEPYQEQENLYEENFYTYHLDDAEFELDEEEFNEVWGDNGYDRIIMVRDLNNSPKYMKNENIYDYMLQWDFLDTQALDLEPLSQTKLNIKDTTKVKDVIQLIKDCENTL